jgi:hypothetical protein
MLKPTPQLWQSSPTYIRREDYAAPHWPHVSDVSLVARLRTRTNAWSFWDTRMIRHAVTKFLFYDDNDRNFRIHFTLEDVLRDGNFHVCAVLVYLNSTGLIKSIKYVFTSVIIDTIMWCALKEYIYIYIYIYKSKNKGEIIPVNRPWRPIGLWDIDTLTVSRESAHRWWWGCQPYAPTVL